MKKPYLLFASSILAAVTTAIAQTQPAPVPAPVPAAPAQPGRPPAPVAIPPPSPAAPAADLPPLIPPQPSVHPVAPVPPAALPALPQAPLTQPRLADPTRPLTQPLTGALPPMIEGVMQEEGEMNLEAAVRSYEAAIDQFDQQRENAANAIFRLGETLRKLGRNEEAKLQYGRVLREFPDHASLAKISHERFSMLADAPSTKRRSVRGASRGSAPYTDIGFSPTGNVQAQRESIQKEIALVNEQLRAAEGLVATGLGSRDAIIPLKREILQLERRLAALDEPGRDNQRPTTDPPLEVAPSPRTKVRPESGKMTPSKPAANSAQDTIFNDETQDLQRELEELIQTFAAARRELAASREKLDMVQGSSPESLPQPVSKDERYQKRKAVYEAAVTASPTDEAAQQKSAEEREQALKQLRTWVEQIYVPELESALRFSEKRAKQLEQQLAETRARLQQISARREKTPSGR